MSESSDPKTQAQDVARDQPVRESVDAPAAAKQSQGRQALDATWFRTTLAVLQTLGIVALGIAALTYLVAYGGTSKQLEASNKRIADLLTELGKAEIRIGELGNILQSAEQRVETHRSVIERLDTIDLERVTKALDLLSSEAAVASLTRVDEQNRIREIEQNLRLIFASAYHGSKDDHRKDEAFLRDVLATIYALKPEMRGSERSVASQSAQVSNYYSIQQGWRRGKVPTQLHFRDGDDLISAATRNRRMATDRLHAALQDAMTTSDRRFDAATRPTK